MKEIIRQMKEGIRQQGRLGIVRAGCAVIGFTVLGLALTGFAQSAASGGACENLAKQTLPDTTATMAQSYGAGEFKTAAPAGGPQSALRGDTSQLPAICRVQATVRTSSETEVKLELWLPSSGWNGSLMALTFPGFRGSSPERDIVDGVTRGYAALMSTGEGLGSAPTTCKSPEKQIDWGYRGLHVITVAAKAFAAAFYGSPVKHAYFLGCSEGGREGFNAAHHYPADFDGIIVGGSGNQFARINAAQLYPAWLISKNTARFIPEPKYTMVHNAAVKVCDSLDGVVDGVIGEPRNCPFDPNTLLCKGVEADDCLTAPQIELLKMIYAGAINPRTKELIFPGPAVGSEPRVFEFANDKKPMGGALNLYQYAVFNNDPNWDWKMLDFDKDVALATQKVGPYLHTTPADLKAFLDSGNKLIIWDGWNDYNSPYYWMNYYAELQKLFGAAKVSKSVKMYFSPGMNHCAGGEGCDTFDKVGAIASWVETGKAPERILASHLDKGKVAFSRPLCVYPQVAKYKGTGDNTDAANFVCADYKPAGKK